MGKEEKISQLGDGKCNDKTYNSLKCGFDGGDCVEFEKKYPTCTIEAPYEPYKIGDGSCDPDPPFYTQECGWDGGDCPIIIKGQASLNTLTGASLTDIYNIGHREVEVTTEKGSWVETIQLPNGTDVPEGSKFRIKCNSIAPISIQHYYDKSSPKCWMMKMVNYNE